MRINEFKEYLLEKSFWFEETYLEETDLEEEDSYNYILNYEPYTDLRDYTWPYNEYSFEYLKENLDYCEFDTINDTGYSYQQLLRTYPWSLRRLEIILLSSLKCSRCGTLENLEVHHKVYVNNLAPWNYHIDDLITLCRNCHQEIHDNENIPEISMLEYKIGLLGGDKPWRYKKPIKFDFINPYKYSPPVEKIVEEDNSFLGGCLFNLFWVAVLIIIVRVISSFL
jgi:5-methylcytosine-specific restriction endonuclease McrA